MAGSIDRPNLIVEGKDDLFSIVEVVKNYGVNYDDKPWPDDYPIVKVVEGVDTLLEGIETAITAAAGGIVGFVVDADSPLASRWQAIRVRFERVGVDVPAEPPSVGFIGESKRFKVRVGTWLMPDNVNDGTLEDFLTSLIDEEVALIGHAETATDDAIRLGATFSESNQRKAIVHAWLAWQEEPGLPFGTAFKAKYFRADLPAGNHFAEWFKSLFHIPD